MTSVRQILIPPAYSKDTRAGELSRLLYWAVGDARVYPVIEKYMAQHPGASDMLVDMAFHSGNGCLLELPLHTIARWAEAGGDSPAAPARRDTAGFFFL